jgi:predicted P-loop ATPase
MKRIKAACICQTLHFMLKEDAEHDWAVQQIQQEVEHYKKSLERNRTQYKIVEETTQPDGSIIIKIIKQYNYSPVGDYLD